MLNCESIDPLVTPYVDGQLDDAELHAVDQHLRRCPPCHSRVAAERAVRTLIQARKPDLAACRAPGALRARCAAQASASSSSSSAALSRGAGGVFSSRAGATRPATWRSRFAPLAAAASLVLIVGAAFLYQLTASSANVLAAELAADHVKCFALNDVLHTHEDAAAVESSMLNWFDWPMRLPSQATKQAGLELVGSRPCLYGQGKVAHIMYRHNGQPVSLFMLPKTERAAQLVQALGHQAAIWCEKDRTFVLIARERKEDVQRIASLVQASLR